jgi:hypothetical protein
MNYTVINLSGVDKSIMVKESLAVVHEAFTTAATLDKGGFTALTQVKSEHRNNEMYWYERLIFVCAFDVSSISGDFGEWRPVL